MTEPLSAERLAEITACERETRDGPWILADANDGDGTPPMWVLATSEAENEDCDWAVHIHVGDKGVGGFIAMARTAVPELLAEVDRLTAELAKAREDQQWLAALEAAGVDNWVGYDMARKMHREHELKTGAHTYAVDVFYMDNNHWFGPDGWTWCPVIDGEPEDNTSDLPHCADEADARAKAAAWLASKTGGPTRD